MTMISDSIEAGISLLGSEVKAFVRRKCNSTMALRFRSGELWLEGLRLRPTALQLDSVPTNKTALENCCHRAELKRLSDQVDRGGVDCSACDVLQERPGKGRTWN